MFKESDYEGLTIINCLKNSGMPLKDIKVFLEMVNQGDASIEQRLELIEKQRGRVLQQMEDLQQILKILDFKVWYYSTAIPAELREVRRKLKDMHYHPQMEK